MDGFHSVSAFIHFALLKQKKPYLKSKNVEEMLTLKILASNGDFFLQLHCRNHMKLSCEKDDICDFMFVGILD